MADARVEAPAVEPVSGIPAEDKTVNGTQLALESSTEFENAKVEIESKDAEKSVENGTATADRTENTKEAGTEELKSKDDRTKSTKEDSTLQKPEPSKPFSDKRDHDRGRSQYKGKRGNKSDLTSQKESDDPVAIRKQVEFYFSDSNLAIDKFLFAQVEGHKNRAVPIDLIHSFKRMRHFQPLSAIIAALKESNHLGVVDNDTAIQRKVPIASNMKDKTHDEIQKVIEDEAMARSVYAKGFGNEEPNTQFDIEAFFAAHGSTNQVRLRRDNMKHFKGSVFVEYDSEETAKRFLALDPKPKYNGRELLIKSKKQYCDDKVEDLLASNIPPKKPQSVNKRRARDEDDSRDWRERREEDRKNGFKNRRHGKGGDRKGHGNKSHDQRDHHDRPDKHRNRERDVKDPLNKETGESESKERPVPSAELTTTEAKETSADTQALGSQAMAVEAQSYTKKDILPASALPDTEPGSPVSEASLKKRPREEEDCEAEEPKAKKVEIEAES